MTLRYFVDYLIDIEGWTDRRSATAVLRRAAVNLGVTEDAARALPLQDVIDASERYISVLHAVLGGMEMPIPDYITIARAKYEVVDMPNMSYGLWSDISAMHQIPDTHQRYASVLALLLYPEGNPDFGHDRRVELWPLLLQERAAQFAPILGFFLRSQTASASDSRRYTRRRR